MEPRADHAEEVVWKRNSNEDDRWVKGDESVVAVGDRHDRGVEFLCVGEAA